MITNRHMTMEAELIRWLLLIIAAVALILATATLLAAMPAEPGLLPADIAETATPMATIQQPYFPEAPPARKLPPAETAARMWMTLEHQRAGRVQEALAGWEPLELPPAKAHWREIGMAAAYLQAGDHERAEKHLEVARELAPNNALLAYYMGILHLEQAAAVGRELRPMNANHRFLVATFTPQERAMYETLAMQELNQVIALAAEVRLDEPLLDLDPAIAEAVIVPRVGDLLVALEATNFTGKAHHLLFALHLDRHELIEAELNLDMVADTGMATLYGYLDLADAYLADERHGDAARVLRKDLRVNHPWVHRACNRVAEMAYAQLKRMWTW